MMEGPGADSEEKHEPVSDIDTAVVVVGLKALDPEWPIREAIGGRADLPGALVKPTHMAQAVWKGVGMRGVVSATPVSRSWSTDLNRTGSLIAPDAPCGVCSH